jgi:hypothetical protein
MNTTFDSKPRVVAVPPAITPGDLTTPGSETRPEADRVAAADAPAAGDTPTRAGVVGSNGKADPAAQIAPAQAVELVAGDPPASTAKVVAFEGTASLMHTAETALAFDHYKKELVQLVERGLGGDEQEDSKALFNVFRLYHGAFGWLLSSSVQRPLSHEVLASKYVSLWTVLERPDLQRYSAQALLGVRALSAGRTKMSSAIFREIEFQTSTPAALSYVMIGVGTFIRGLLMAMILLGYLAFLIFHDVENVPLSLSGTWFNVAVAAVCGMLGSVISILLRLSEFETTRGRSQMFLILTGATLPLIGAFFGGFVAALLSAKIIAIDIGDKSSSSTWLYVVLGLLSGFSERFSQGLIRIAEDRFAPSVGPPGSAAQQHTAGTVDATIAGTAKLAPQAPGR